MSNDLKAFTLIITFVVFIVWGLAWGFTRCTVTAINKGYIIITDKDNHRQYIPPNTPIPKELEYVEKEIKH